MGNRIWIVLRRIRNIRRFLNDANQPFFKKIAIIFGIIYLLSPVDLVPEPVFGLGILDDLILWALILSWLSESLDSYPGSEKLWPFSRKNDDTNVYETEARIIEDEDEDEEESGQTDSSEGEKTK